MERVGRDDRFDGEHQDDPWAGHPAAGWMDEPASEPRRGAGAGRDDDPWGEHPAASFEEPAPRRRREPETASWDPEPLEAWHGDERGESVAPGEEAPGQAPPPDRWQPEAYDDEPEHQAAITRETPGEAGQVGSSLTTGEPRERQPWERRVASTGERPGDGLVEELEDWEEDRYGQAPALGASDSYESPVPLVRRRSWRPADTFIQRKPWEQAPPEAGAEPDDEGRGQRLSRGGAMAPQRGPAVAEEEPPWTGSRPARARDEGHRRHRTVIREVVETGLLAILVFLSVRASFQNFKVDGASMQPTLEDGQFLIVNKLIYSEIDLDKIGTFFPFISGGENPKRNVFHGPERGDIVVLQDPRSPSTDLIKRIVGLPGETLEIVDGQVFVNDFLLEEPYITTEWNDSRPMIAIPEDYYFVMGDNRENSLDSRSQQVGLIHKDLIIGKAMFSYWPTNKFGLAPNGSGKLTEELRPAVTAQRIEEFAAAN